MKYTITFLLGLLVYTLAAQPVFLKEIPNKSEQFISANGKAYFFSGDSLYVSDGTTTGTQFVERLGEEPFTFNYSFNRYKYLYDQNAEIGGSVIFRTEFASGQSLWRSDGTAINTVKLGSFESIELLYIHNSVLYLAIDDGVHGPEVWKLDAGFNLSLVKDIFPGMASGYPHNMTLFQNKLYFIYDDDLYFTDGTSAGTMLAVDYDKGILNNLTEVNGALYFSAKYYYDNEFGMGLKDEVLKSDGTFVGTVVLKEFEDELADGLYNFHDFISFKDKLYFFNHRFSFEEEFWMSDGTSDGTVVLKSDVVTDGPLLDVFIVNDQIVFYGSNQGFIGWIWISDGTEAGTSREIPVKVEALGDVVPFKNLLFYGDHDGPSTTGSAENQEDEYQLMQSQLTLKSTKAVRKIFDSGDYRRALNIVAVEDKIIFSTNSLLPLQPHDTTQARLWIYDPFKPAANVPYFTVVDSDTDKDIQWLKTKDTIYKKPDQNINIRYNPVTPAGSVKFLLADTTRRVEGTAPYALAGDFSGNYSPWLEANPGNHKLTAIQYSSSGAKGTVQHTLISDFVIIEDVPNRAPVITTDTFHLIALPQDSIILTASISDPDGDDFTWLWFTESGPNFPDVSDAGAFSSKFSGLIEGEYIFRIRARDEFFASSFVDVKVIVREEPVVPEGMRIVLVNADTDTDIRDLNAQDTIIYNPSMDKISIRAIPEGAAGSVQFFLDGNFYRNENAAPYALQGDNNGNYAPWNPAFGNYTLNVKTFTGSSGKGTLIENKTIQLVVKQPGMPPVPPAQITFTLVNAETDEDIGPLADGQTIDLSNLPTDELNIRANSTLAGTKSVVFAFNGNNKFRTEGSAPYALFGDSNGDYFEHDFDAGTFTLKATPYTGNGGSGTAGVPLEITFHIVEGANAQLISVTTYPNPVEERLSVAIQDFHSEAVNILIYNESGSMMYEGYETIENGKGDFNIELLNLRMKPGLYFVRIRSEETGEEVVKKIFKK